jgi:hypothetical protein
MMNINSLISTNAEAQMNRKGDTMSEAQELQATYQRVRELQAQQKCALARREELQAQEADLEKQLEAVEQKRVAALDAYLGGPGSEADVIAAEEELSRIGDSLRRCHDMLKASGHAMQTCDVAMAGAKRTAASAREAYCESLVEPLILKARKAVSDLLLEAYATRVASLDPSVGSYGSLPWDWFLDSVFPQLPNDKIERALEAASLRVEKATGGCQ